MKDFWRNDYDRICWENEKRLDGVSGKNRVALIRMFWYVAAFPVSLFQLEVVKKDLIGLASDADMEKISLEEKLGVPEEEFCKALIEEGKTSRSVEKLLLIARDAILALFIFYTFDFVFNGFSNQTGLEIDVVFFAVFCEIGREVLRAVARRRSGYQDSKKKSRIVFLCYAIIVLFYVGWISIGMKGIAFFPGHGWLIFVILLAAAAGIWFINCRYWNRCSTQYDWK